MKKAIVTGSAGFIGRALVKRLEEDGIKVINVDRMDPDLSWDAGHIKHIITINGRPDVIFHLAAQTSVFNTDKLQIIYDNITAFHTVCDISKDYGIKLVYASSSCAAPGNATSLYGISKRFDEDYARCYNPEATGIRFHNVYGSDPRQGTLLWHLLNDEKVRLFNKGRNRRHFTYIDDIIESLLYAVESKEPLLNAVNPELTSTRQFAEMVAKYKPLDLELVDETRPFDKEEQFVDVLVPKVPILYTPVEIGIATIFADSRKWYETKRENHENGRLGQNQSEER